MKFDGVARYNERQGRRDSRTFGRGHDRRNNQTTGDTDEVTVLESERRNDSWQDRAFEHLSPEDRQTMDKFRRSFEQRGANQTWYYAAAGTDALPVLIAPSDTKHWNVDIRYANDYVTVDEGKVFRDRMQIPFKELGVKVEEIPADDRTDLIIDSSSEVHLENGDATHQETLPAERPDVVFNTETSWSGNLGPVAAMAHLKPGGLFVDLGRSEQSHERRLPSFGTDKSPEDYGIQKLVQVQIKALDIPAISDTSSISRGQTGVFTVFEKTREFTATEIDELRAEELVDAVRAAITFVLQTYIEPELTEYQAEAMKEFELKLQEAVQYALGGDLSALDTIGEVVSPNYALGTDSKAFGARGDVITLNSLNYFLKESAGFSSITESSRALRGIERPLIMDDMFAQYKAAVDSNQKRWLRPVYLWKYFPK